MTSTGDNGALGEASTRKAAAPAADRIRRDMEEGIRETLRSRCIAVTWTILAGLVSFSLAKAWFEPATGLFWYGPALALLLLQVAVLGLLRRQTGTAGLERLLLADTLAACAIIVALGIDSGHTVGSDFYLMGLAVNTAAVVPWRPRRQVVLAVAAGLGIFATGYGVHGSVAAAVDFRTIVPALLLAAASVFTSKMMEAARLHSAHADLLRARAEEETLEANAMLERRVLERTVELQAANGELEAFSYSVSHDLRAPLRAMDGLSQALLEDYAEQLDNLGKDYLRRIRGEASRLGDLVDDLLRLSRVTRSVMRRRDVDLSSLVTVEAERLLGTEPERDVTVTVAPDLIEHCDEYLVRIALQNLLGNAFKFTQRTIGARIEFGFEQNKSERVYFVRDNGVGFDMAHVKKVFEAFERLHSSEEFDGTGIGLTTVDRIVRRHGGTISAEAEPDRGAMFRFTLCPAGTMNP